MSRWLPIGRKTCLWLSLALVGLAGATFAWPQAAAQYYRYCGQAALRAQHDQQALDCFLTAEKFDVASAETQIFLARSYRRLWRFDDMARHLERADVLGASRRRVKREQMLALAQSGRMDEPGGRLIALLDDPGDDGAEICAALVTGYSLRDQLDLASAVLVGWMSRYPDDPEPLWRCGQLRYSQSDWPDAVKMCRRCLELAPGRSAARLLLAQSLLKMNDPAAAEPELRRCLRELPESIEARTGLGASLFSNGKVDEARSVLEQAVNLAPHDFESRRQLAELELSVGRAGSAIGWIEPLVEHWPEDKQLCTLMARALQESGRADQARPYWDRAERAEEALKRVDSLIQQARADPSATEPRFELGMLLMKHHSREDGVGWLQSLVRVAPRHRAAHLALADYYAATGAADLAAEHRRRAESVGEEVRAP
jgi:tetratricopeptide (TPR) repeat protein